ncbi:MAG: hypothetical protein IPL08_17815 [Saprospiraceae bacterium]|nr:hypothetical protein [Saprospiraceae bacterium]
MTAITATDTNAYYCDQPSENNIESLLLFYGLALSTPGGLRETEPMATHKKVTWSRRLRVVSVMCKSCQHTGQGRVDRCAVQRSNAGTSASSGCIAGINCSFCILFRMA